MKIISCKIPQIDYSTLETNNPKNLEIIFTASLNTFLSDFQKRITEKFLTLQRINKLLIVSVKVMISISKLVYDLLISLLSSGITEKTKKKHYFYEHY